MRTRTRGLVRELTSRFAGDHALPIGDVARDRRLLRRALGDRDPGAVLVVGPGLAVRQALPHAAVDVAGVTPHQREVTVCSIVSGARSLPAGRWDTVVITDPGPAFAERLEAVAHATRPGGRLLVLGRADQVLEHHHQRDLRRVAEVTQVVGRRANRVWVGELPA